MDRRLTLHDLDSRLAKYATDCSNTFRLRPNPSAPAFSLLTQPAETRRRVPEFIERR